MEQKKLKFETLQVHAGQTPDGDTGSRAVPIYLTSGYVFKSAQSSANLFALKEFGNIYTRLMNPTTDVFEQRVAALEGGVAALAVASGHSAQMIAITNIMQQGDNFISSPFLYGGSFNQFKSSFSKMGIECRFSSSLKPTDFEKLVDKNTKAIYVESIGNSNFSVPDFQALADMAHRNGIPLIVDNTFGAAGYLCRPMDFGADIIVESATKWICGHGTVMGGVIVDAGRFDWSNGKFPLIDGPSDSYHGMNLWEAFGAIAFILKCRVEGLRDQGPAISPFNSHQMLIGLETLSLRVERSADNALALARYLESHPMVESVNYPGLESSAWYAMGKKYLQNGSGCVLSVVLKSTKEQAIKFVDDLKMISNVANVGDTRTLIIQPAATTHQQMDEQALAAAGIAPTMLRISLGIEHIDDIIADLDGAFSAIK